MIGTLSLPSRFLLAPLAGISDLPYRLLNRRFGCGFAFFEMLSARSLVYQGRRIRKMVAGSAEDRPVGVQLLAKDPDDALRALDMLDMAHIDLLDLNAACPVPKIVAKGQGAALLKAPKRLSLILDRLARSVSVPVTVKIRTGWDGASVNAVEISRIASESGVAAVFIHGRTKVQGYGGEVDYRTIRDVKESLGIPVIGSGNILSARLAARMFDETGCDAVTVARGALGNPWIFPELEAFFERGEDLPAPASEEVSSVMKDHLSACTAFHGEKVGTMLFRKFFGWYTRGFANMKPLREEAFLTSTEAGMLHLIAQAGKSVRVGSGVSALP